MSIVFISCLFSYILCRDVCLHFFLFIARAQREINRQISRIIKKTQNDDELTIEEEALLQKNPKVFDEISKRNKRRKTTELRKQEIEDSPSVLAKKCDRMAKAIQKAKYLIGK